MHIQYETALGSARLSVLTRLVRRRSTKHSWGRWHDEKCEREAYQYLQGIGGRLYEVGQLVGRGILKKESVGVTEAMPSLLRIRAAR